MTNHTPYLHTPGPCNTHFGTGAVLGIELHRRIFGGAFGRVPRPLWDDAFNQAGYIIDAPELIPGGGCYFDEFASPDEDGERNWVVSQFTTERDIGAAS